MGTRFVLYADLGGLLHTDLFASFVPAALQLASSAMTAEQVRCLRGALEGVREVAVGSNDDDGLLVARVEDRAFDVPACLAVAGAKPTQIDGAKEAYALKDSVVVREPGVLLIGTPPALGRALANTTAPKAVPASISLGPDEYVAWSATPEEGVRAQGTVVASNERFRVGVQADVPEPLASRVERQLRGVQAMGGIPGLQGPERELVGKLLHAVELKRDAGHLEGAFELREPPVDQARDLGTLASLGIFGVRRYLAEAKMAEARSAVGQIAKDYAAWWEKEDGKPRARKKLVSFPPVPRTVPRGVKYQSSPADWKPWEPLRFSMDVPQYYQYEVHAAKNGESAEILARGDLDGDGQTSLFKLTVHVDRAHGDVLVIDPSIAETDPEE
jgi:hypothetical protein